MSGFDQEEFQDDMSDAANIAGFAQRRQQTGLLKEQNRLLASAEKERQRIASLPKCPECKNSVNVDANVCGSCNTNLYWFDDFLVSSLGAMKQRLELLFVEQNDKCRSHGKSISSSLSSIISASLSYREASKLLDVHAGTRKRVEEYDHRSRALEKSKGFEKHLIPISASALYVFWAGPTIPSFVLLATLCVAFYAVDWMLRKNAETERDQLQSYPNFKRVAAVWNLREPLSKEIEQTWSTLCSHWAKAHNASVMMRRLRNTASTYSAVFPAADPSESRFKGQPNPGCTGTDVERQSSGFIDVVNTIDPNLYAATKASHSFSRPITVLRDTRTSDTLPQQAQVTPSVAPEVPSYSPIYLGIRKTYGRLLDMSGKAFQREKPLFTLPKGQDDSVDPMEEAPPAPPPAVAGGRHAATGSSSQSTPPISQQTSPQTVKGPPTHEEADNSPILPSATHCPKPVSNAPIPPEFQAASETISIKCSCGANLAAKRELSGETVKCPKCKRPIVVP